MLNKSRRKRCETDLNVVYFAYHINGGGTMYKNIEKQTVLQLKDLVEYQKGQVVSKTLVQNDHVSMTLFSFDKGEEISTHAAGGDAMVTVLDGMGRFTVGGEVFVLTAGETLIMPKDIPHAVYGEMVQTVPPGLSLIFHEKGDCLSTMLHLSAICWWYW